MSRWPGRSSSDLESLPEIRAARWALWGTAVAMVAMTAWLLLNGLP